MLNDFLKLQADIFAARAELGVALQSHCISDRDGARHRVVSMYFEDAEDQAVLQASVDTRLVMSLNGVATLALGIVPGWLWALCAAVFAAL